MIRKLLLTGAVYLRNEETFQIERVILISL